MQPGTKTPAQAVRDGAARQRQLRDAMVQAAKANQPEAGRSESDTEAPATGVNAGRESR